MIPKLLHFIWIGPPMPEWARANIEAFRALNPDHEITVHDASILLPKYRRRFDECRHLESQADLLRYSALQRFGGWYFDTDFVPFRPLADIERAYDLDGERLFLSRQAHMRNRANTIANGVMACAADSPVWPAIDGFIVKVPPRVVTIYGPRMMVALTAKHPELFTLATPEWFFPAPAGRAGWLAQIPEAATRYTPATGGQKPFAMHLWAAGKRSYQVRNNAWKTLPGGPRRATLVATERMYLEQKERPFRGVAEGLNACGYSVDVRLDSDPDLTVLADLIVVWNGLKTSSLKVRHEALEARIPCFQMEHGFWERRRYNQIDHQGILHWASWRHLLKGPAPAEGAERVARFYPEGLRPVQARPEGYILVLGQLAGDSQMLDSEISGPRPLQRLVARALQPGTQIFFRPHPLAVGQPSRRHMTLPVLNQPDDRPAYRRTQHGDGLASALVGCRFVICINSNSINEALPLGVPCLAFGPCLGIEAGVVHPTSKATLKADIEAMLEGWCPPQEAVENYLHWLACRQWTGEELADPAVMGPLLEAAGLPVLVAAEAVA